MRRTICFASILGLSAVAVAGRARAGDDCPGVCPLGQVCVAGQCVPQSEAPPGGTATTQPVITPVTTTPTNTTTTTTTPTHTAGTSSTIPIETQTSVPMVHGIAPAVPVTPVPDEGDPWENLFSITIDPLGFALYGPSLKFEVGTFVSGYARVRFPNVGLVHIAQNIGDTEFDWGISAGGGFRGYIGKKSQQGFLLGAGFEIARTYRYTDQSFTRSEVRWGTTSFLPGLEIGYRTVSASGFSFTVSGGAFYIVNLASDLPVTDPGVGSPTDGEVWPIVQLDLGYTF